MPRRAGAVLLRHAVEWRGLVERLGEGVDLPIVEFEDLGVDGGERGVGPRGGRQRNGTVLPARPAEGVVFAQLGDVPPVGRRGGPHRLHRPPEAVVVEVRLAEGSSGCVKVLAGLDPVAARVSAVAVGVCGDGLLRVPVRQICPREPSESVVPVTRRPAGGVRGRGEADEGVVRVGRDMHARGLEPAVTERVERLPYDISGAGVEDRGVNPRLDRGPVTAGDG